MPRVIIIVAAVLATLVAIPAALAVSEKGAATARPLASVRVAECSRGAEALDRHATFRGVMRRVARTHRMWMRFRLQERVGDAGFHTVKAPGLGIWRKSHPAVRRFSHRQRVLALAEGSAYRTVVAFRWYDRDGELIRRTRRRSKPCGQSGVLPNITVVNIGGGSPPAGAPRSSTYTVRVANRRRAETPRFGVRLIVDGGVVDTQQVGGLGPWEVRELSFAGPLCERAVSARADPEDAVREASEKDNRLTVPCPPRG